MHGPTVARLTYPTSPVDVAPAREGEARPAVALRPLADDRPEPRDVVVHVWNGHRNFVVGTPDDVPAWATRAVRIELERSGLRVTDLAEGDTPVIGGAITGADCVAGVPVFQGSVTLRVWMEKGGERPIDRAYSGTGKPGEMGKPTAEIYARCLADALRDAATRLAADASAVARGESPSPVPPPPRPRASGLPTAAGLVLGEAMLAGLSGLAARWPKETGWTLVAVWPLGLLNLQEGTTATDVIVVSGGAVALGLYNALELRSERYSSTQRFWLNMAGWHALIAIDALANRLLESDRTGHRISAGIGVAGGAPALLVGGRL